MSEGSAPGKIRSLLKGNVSMNSDVKSYSQISAIHPFRSVQSNDKKKKKSCRRNQVPACQQTVRKRTERKDPIPMLFC